MEDFVDQNNYLPVGFVESYHSYKKDRLHQVKHIHQNIRTKYRILKNNLQNLITVEMTHF